MIRIAISVDAFEAIARTLPLGSVGYESEPNERGERLIWLEDVMADRLGAMRGPNESYSDAILRLVETGGLVRPIAWLGLLLAAPALADTVTRSRGKTLGV